MRSLILFCMSLVLLEAPALALDPEKREAVVISGRVWDGGSHREVFVPSGNDRLVIVSGRDSIVSFVRTLEYYWPLSRKSYVDFEALREQVDGRLVITSDSGTVAESPAQSYVFVYPEGASKGNAAVLWGEDAEAAYTQYVESERAFRKALVEAQRAQTEYERKLVEAGKARLAGNGIQAIVPPPPLPKPDLRLVTKPARGFRLNLAPGRYTAYVAQAGAVVEETRRTVTVLDHMGRDTIVADIIPEERWTRPLPSDDESSKVYVRPGATFYVTLAAASMFKEEDYLAVIDPQARPGRGNRTWIRRGDAGIVRLDAEFEGKPAGNPRLSRERLKVEQTGGSAFGYRVRPAAEGEPEDLSAFRIAVPADSPGGFVKAPDGSAVFEREIVPVGPRNDGLALLLALLPVIAVAGKRLAPGLVKRPFKRGVNS